MLRWPAGRSGLGPQDARGGPWPRYGSAPNHYRSGATGTCALRGVSRLERGRLTDQPLSKLTPSPRLVSSLLAERTVTGRVRWCGADPAVLPALAAACAHGNDHRTIEDCWSSIQSDRLDAGDPGSALKTRELRECQPSASGYGGSAGGSRRRRREAGHRSARSVKEPGDEASCRSI